MILSVQRQLHDAIADAIRRVAADLHEHAASGGFEEKRYSFEEWAELTRLMTQAGTERSSSAVRV